MKRLTHAECLLAYGSISAALAFAPAALADPQEDGSDVAHEHCGAHENGVGCDPDNDSNPATNTGAFSLAGDAAEAADDPPYSVITFEPPPGKQGDPILDEYKEKYGVSFGNGLTRQICEGQRHFEYNSMCTYEAAPSGRFAAGYLHYLNAPLVIEFKRPVCVVTMAIYPTGGKEGEPFEFKIQGWTETGDKLPDAKAEFEWTKNTVRWRHMAGAYYLDVPAKKIAISMRSEDPKEAKDTLRYLIDDVAFVETGCEAALEDIAKRAGVSVDELAPGAADKPAEDAAPPAPTAGSE